VRGPPSCSASCRSPAWPRRSRRRARPGPRADHERRQTRSSARRTPSDWTRRSPRWTSWSASTSTSTRQTRHAT
jgi:hypothetical protein